MQPYWRVTSESVDKFNQTSLLSTGKCLDPFEQKPVLRLKGKSFGPLNQPDLVWMGKDRLVFLSVGESVGR